MGARYWEASPAFLTDQAFIQKEATRRGKVRWKVHVGNLEAPKVTLNLTKNQLYDLGDAIDKALAWQEDREDKGLVLRDEDEDE